jgi:hypothetical protein
MLLARPGTGNLFAQCSDAVPNISAPETVAWVNKLIGAIGEEESCNTEGPQETLQSGACNIFVGRVLERVYGVTDFVVTPPQADKKFYVANEIATLLEAGVWNDWSQIGTGDQADALKTAKVEADRGRLVVAVWRNPQADQPGHVALVGPGPLVPSGQWGPPGTPPAAQFRLNPGDNAGGNFLGKPLACSFRGQIRAEVKLWVRQTSTEEPN